MATDYASQAFELQRRRALEDVNKTNQQESEALQRRFAAQGGLNSGALIKQQGIQSDNAFQRRQKALEGVDTQELGFKAQQQEAEKQREFAKNERLGGQEFQAGQAGQQRNYLTQERLGTQGFQSGEAGKQRDFGSQQAELQRQFEAAWKGSDRELENEKLKQGWMSLDIARDESAFNKSMADWQREHSGGLLGSGGFLGTGLSIPGAGALSYLTCMHEGTLVMMEDGSFKPIEDVKILDVVAYGGKVLAWGISLVDDLYEHKGIKITGAHAVYEDGRYVRVKKSKYAKKLEKELVKVYPMVTENHYIICDNKVVYSDFAEVNDSISWSDAKRLKELNSPEYRARAKEIEDKLNGN